MRPYEVLMGLYGSYESFWVFMRPYVSLLVFIGP